MSCCDDSKQTAPVVRILLMDDEEMIRDVTGRMLKSLGHDHVIVSNGHDAVEAFKKALEAANPFHMVILDWYVKEGMGGAETARRLLRIDPSALILASSGDHALKDDGEFAECGFAGILSKPYSLRELKESIERFVSRLELRGARRTSSEGLQ